MPGTSGGTGQPIWFKCSNCRRTGWRTSRVLGYHQLNPSNGRTDRIELTGKTKPINDGRSKNRSTSVMRQYKCLDCGHVGWSRHVDLERKERQDARSSVQ